MKVSIPTQFFNKNALRYRHVIQRRFLTDDHSKPDPLARDETSQLEADIKKELLGKYGDFYKTTQRPTTSSKVPSSRVSRLYHYSELAAGLSMGVLSEGFKRLTSRPNSQNITTNADEIQGSNEPSTVTNIPDSGSLFFTPSNIARLVDKLSKMRGAALKLGQMLSIQDFRDLPAPIQAVLQRVQNSAHYMPITQMEDVMTKSFGSRQRWNEELFAEFDPIPIAAASIGQVHSAFLKRDSGENIKVAVKVQYPGVSDSIDSDLKNLGLLLTASRLLPRGLFLDKTIEAARHELEVECDYTREAANLEEYRQFLTSDTDFVVPRVFLEATTDRVLTMEWMDGTPLSHLAANTQLPQSLRDWIGAKLMRLCFRELMEFQFMQTDPNWTNFLYNNETQQIELLDLGAGRRFPREFMQTYVQILIAASECDRTKIERFSRELKYLTDADKLEMINAHVDSVLVLAEPFNVNSPEQYDFGSQTITDRVRALIPTMIKNRTSPPPPETYALHRKLSGLFLLCTRLKSKIPCRSIFHDVLSQSSLMKD